jgi:ABC-type branched-subunit amino acid transport system substrate-binding protein
MDRNAKRISALVIIAVIATGGIVGVILLMESPSPPFYVVPGVPDGETFTDDQLIKIGIIGPLENIQGESCLRAAYLAAWEINAAGGVDVNGTTHYIALTSEDTGEAAASPDTARAVAAARRLLDVKGAEFFIGGFRTEVVTLYREAILDEGKIFMGTGAATPSLNLNLSDPSTDPKYNYWFMNMPHDSDMQGYCIGQFLKKLTNTLPDYVEAEGIADPTGPYNGTDATFFNVTNITILREAKTWTEGFAQYIGILLANNPALVDYYDPLYPTPIVPNVVTRPFDETFDEDDWNSLWTTIDGTDQAQIVIPLASQISSAAMVESYYNNQPLCMLAGVDVPASSDDFWTETDPDGACDGEIVAVSSAGLGTNYTVYGKRFYDSYKGNYTTSPLYSGTGAYDSIRLLVHAIEETNTLNQSQLVAEMQSWTILNPVIDKTAASPFFAYTTYGTSAKNAVASWAQARGLYYFELPGPTYPFMATMNAIESSNGITAADGRGYYTVFFAQWQNGTMKCIPGGAYPDSVTQGDIIIPSQGMWGTVEDAL